MKPSRQAINQQAMKTYYLFGRNATKIFYESESLESIASEIKKEIYGLFVEDDTTTSIDLLNSYDGWDGYAIIPEELYELIKK